jgi:hypothetical protein
MAVGNPHSDMPRDPLLALLCIAVIATLLPVAILLKLLVYALDAWTRRKTPRHTQSGNSGDLGTTPTGPPKAAVAKELHDFLEGHPPKTPVPPRLFAPPTIKDLRTVRGYATVCAPDAKAWKTRPT